MKYGVWAIAAFMLYVFSSCGTHRMSSLYGDGRDTISMPEVSVNATKAVYQGSKKKYFDLPITELHIRIDIKAQSVNGKAILTVKPHAYPHDSILLDAKNFTIKSIGELKGDVLRPLSYSSDKNFLRIALGKSRPTNELIKLQIEYSAFPQARLDSGLIKTRDKLGLTFINPDGSDSLMPTQFWSQGETEYNSAWFPTIESTDQKMRQDIYLTVDSAYVTLSNGKMEGKTSNGDGTITWHWKMDQPHAPYLAMIAGGKWAVIHDKWRNKIPVDYYVEPKYAPYARMIFGNTPEMIEFFSKVLKYDYPWPKYSQVVARQYTSGAMENTTATLEYEIMQHDARTHLDNTGEDVISHELFHQWFGDLVTCESWDYLSMNESFATLGEFLWKEHKYGLNEAALRKQEALAAYLREASYNKEAVISHFYKDAEELFDRHRYEKGGLILDMLRTYLGDEVFFAGLTNYLHERQFKTSELAYFRMVMEEASGEDLKWFFSQWFEQPGHPDLEITHSYDSKNKQLTLFIRQLQPVGDEPLFRLPVDIDIFGTQGVSHKKIFIEHRRDSFMFPMENEPLLVNFDAKKYLLCHKQEGKNTSEWLYQYYHCKGYQDKYEALQALSIGQKNLNRDTLKHLMHTALYEPFWALRKAAIGAFFAKADNYQGEFRERIRFMALRDPNSHVREEALQYIQVLEKSQGEDIYRSALKDSSYALVSLAMAALFAELPKQDSVEKLQIAQPFEAYYNSPDVLAEVMGIYGKHGGIDKLLFFHKMPYVVPGKYLNGVLGNYRRLLFRTNAKVVQSEIPFLSRLRKKMHSFWELMAYKNLVHDLNSAIKDNKLDKGGLSKSDLEDLESKLQSLSSDVKLEKFGY